ncbi:MULTISPECIES: hypothetical protein [Candidatus Ichthyocystis]|nr:MULTISPECIES: hypothetical protein [Ichthyocystis]
MLNRGLPPSSPPASVNHFLREVKLLLQVEEVLEREERGRGKVNK